ncbi:MAG: hypothetical protein WBD22_06630 [Pyrinomonadaceae bacterium]
MNKARVIFLTVFFFLTAQGMAEQQGIVLSKAEGQQVLLLGKILDLNDQKLRFSLTLRNEGTENIFFSSNPQRLKGEYGPYISIDVNDRSVVNIEWRVFEPISLAAYSDETGVELKKLGPNESVSETITLNWPLQETVPPIDLHFKCKRIDRKDLKQIRLTVGYFVENDGILDFLSRKPFGWFIKGRETLYSGAFKGKTFLEIQELVSDEIVYPEKPLTNDEMDGNRLETDGKRKELR